MGMRVVVYPGRLMTLPSLDYNSRLCVQSEHTYILVVCQQKFRNVFPKEYFSSKRSKLPTILNTATVGRAMVVGGGFLFFTF